MGNLSDLGNPEKEKTEDGLINAHVSERLRLRREELGITKTALASALDISPRQLTKMERGQARLAASHLFKAAQFLETTIEAFFEGTPDDGFRNSVDNSQPKTCKSISPYEVEQLQRYFLDTPDGPARRNVLKMIKAAAQAKI